ncbi:MAG: sulfatase [Segetibacter sp.]|jgi:arylsulfatase A-like enzyme|nr:sulfatase [Segetibacter sp.]
MIKPSLLYISALLICYNTYSQVNKSEKSSSQKPNVLFIVADDMSTFGFLKNYPVLKTPALDKLISQSYYFKNATCAAPVCIPSRASFWTGMSPNKSGSYFNTSNTWENTILSNTEVMPETFKKNGYTTWARGKIFHLELNDNREKKMFDNTIFKGGYGPFGDRENGYSRNRWMNIQPWTGPDSDFADVKNADAGVEFLSQKHDKPFFMYYGLFRPHSPYTMPKRFMDMYKDANITVPPGYQENDLDDVPQLGRDLVDSMKPYRKANLTKRQVWIELMRAYCANYSFADWNIGKILEALDKSEFAKNTIVVFCSDNGFQNGAKDHWAKSTLWDQSDNIPFLIRLPNGKAYRCPQTVSLIDIFPTLIEYCGINGPSHKLDGKSIVPVLKDASAKWDRNGVTFYGEEYTGVRSERYRYIRYHDGSEELYDHDTDPYEHVNLAKNPSKKTVIQQLSKSVPKSFEKSLGKKGAENAEE